MYECMAGDEEGRDWLERFKRRFEDSLAQDAELVEINEDDMPAEVALATPVADEIEEYASDRGTPREAGGLVSTRCCKRKTRC